MHDGGKEPRPHGLHDEHAARRCGLDDGRGVLDARGEGLLHQQGLAGLDRLQRQLRVLRVGGGEVDDVDVGREQLVIAAVGLRNAVSPANSLARSDEREPTATSSASGTWANSRGDGRRDAPGTGDPQRTVIEALRRRVAGTSACDSTRS